MNLLSRIWIFLNLVWFRLMRLAKLQSFPKCDGTTHKIVIIGDGLAEGFGGSINFMNDSGIAHNLKKKLYADVRINHNWFVINRGYYKSLSEDWLPEAKKKPSHLPFLIKENLFKNTFENSNTKDAEVVMIVLGNEDNYCERKELRGNPIITVNNIKIIAKELIRRGKVVSVAYLLPPKGTKNVLIEHKNKLLDNLFKELEEKYPTQFISGPKLYFRLYEKFERFSDNFHVGSEAYQAIATRWFDMLANNLIKI